MQITNDTMLVTLTYGDMQKMIDSCVTEALERYERKKRATRRVHNLNDLAAALGVSRSTAERYKNNQLRSIVSQAEGGRWFSVDVDEALALLGKK